MTDLVTIEQARAQLRNEGTPDDDDLRLKISAASEMVLAYIGRAADAFIDGDGVLKKDKDGKPLTPATVQLATLVTVNYLYRERDGSQKNAIDPQFGYGCALPKSAVSMLFKMRLQGMA